MSAIAIKQSLAVGDPKIFQIGLAERAVTDVDCKRADRQ
jgi:hypothetical protein